MTLSPDLAASGYAQRVLADGAHPVHGRSAVYRLLGALPGECSRRAGYALPHFVYALPVFLEDGPAADITGLAEATKEQPPMAPPVPVTELALPDPAGNVAVANGIRAVPAAAVEPKPAPTPFVAADAPIPATAEAAETWLAAPLPPVPVARTGASLAAHRPAEPDHVSVPAWNVEAPRTVGENSAGARAIDAAAFPPALQKVLPLLGRLRMAKEEQAAEASPPVMKRSLAEPRVASRVEQASARIAPRAAQELTAPALQSPAFVAAAMPRMLPPAPLGRAEGTVLQRTVSRLQQTTRALARALGEVESTVTERATAAGEPPHAAYLPGEPVVIQEVTREAPAATRAFWERRYLGRPHMRARR